MAIKAINTSITKEASKPIVSQIVPRFDIDKGFVRFAYQNAVNYAPKYIEKGNRLFISGKFNLVHVLEDKNINGFRDGIRLNNYNLYEKYINVPEFLFMGKSNSGKSALLNALFGKNLAAESKTLGKTQKLEFFLLSNPIVSKNLPNISFFIDSPGYGDINGPAVLKNKFQYMLNTYLFHSVRLKLIFFLVNSDKGLEKEDWIKLKEINEFNTDISLVMTKVDDIYKDSTNIIKVKELSHLTRDLKNVRSEIILTSAKVGYGIENLRTYIENEINQINKYHI